MCGKMDCALGWGTDENSLIAILGDRTTDELQVLKKMYKTMHGKDLEKELMSELSGDLKYTVKLLMMSRAERDSYCLSKAMAGLGTDEMVLIEILTSRSNQEIEAISSVFEKHNKRSLEAALRCGASCEVYWWEKPIRSLGCLVEHFEFAILNLLLDSAVIDNCTICILSWAVQSVVTFSICLMHGI